MQAQTVAFIDDMAARYGEADLVICRAGALTVSELAAAGVASVLVPFPHAVDDHQTHNARFLADAGAAVLVQQRELSAAPTRRSAARVHPREAARDGHSCARARQARSGRRGGGGVQGVGRMSYLRSDTMKPKTSKPTKRATGGGGAAACRRTPARARTVRGDDLGRSPPAVPARRTKPPADR